MTHTRRTSSIHLRKKPLPSEVLSSIGSHLDKAKKRETFFGVMFSIGEMLRLLPWPGIKTEFYESNCGPQSCTTFQFATSPINDDKEEERETVYKRMTEQVRILGSQGVPREKLRNLLVDFDPWNRKLLEHKEKLVTAIRTALEEEQKRLGDLNLFLSDPPVIYPLPPESSAALVAYASHFQRKLKSDEQTVQRAVKLLASAKQKFSSKKSSHLRKMKGSLFQLIRKSTDWSRNRTAHELTALLSAWNTNLAGKDSSHRIASYRR